MSKPNTKDVGDDKPMVLKDEAVDKNKSHGLGFLKKKPKSPKSNKPNINIVSDQQLDPHHDNKKVGGAPTKNGHSKQKKSQKTGDSHNIFSKLGKMGRIFKKSNSSSNEANAEINSKLKQEKLNRARTLRILLLGAGGSGKTTVFKQMEKLYNGDIEEKTLELAKEDIHRNILVDVYDLCKYNFQLCSSDTNDEYKLSTGELTDICHRISTWPSHFVIEDPASRLDHELAKEISRLWKDNAMKNTWNRRRNFHIMDNTPYFFEKILEIVPDPTDNTAPEYKVTFDDFVRVRDQTTGIIVKHFIAQTEFGQYNFEVTDVGGQRSERRKWMRLFDNISVVVYIMSLAAYDQYLFEDHTKKCWDETLELFQKTSHEAVFDTTDWVIFFNKVDIFEKKILKIPFTVYQPNFNELHRNDAVKVKEYIKDEFTHRFYEGLNKERKNRRGHIYFHVTCATNKDDVGRIIQKVQIDLVKSQMKKMGYLL